MEVFLQCPDGHARCVEVTTDNFTVRRALKAAKLSGVTLSRDGVTYDVGARLRDLGLQDGDTLDVKPTEAAAAQQLFKERGLKMTYDALVNAVASRNEERVRGLLQCVSLTEGERTVARYSWSTCVHGIASPYRLNEGLPVLMVAAQYSTPSIVRMLLRAGEDPNQRGSPKSYFWLACRRAGYRNSDQQPTALHYAAKVARDSGNMEALLDGGANPNLADAFDCTPLMILAERKDDVTDLIGFLVSRGAEVNKVSNKKMALGRAVVRGNVANVRALLERGAVGNGGVLRLPDSWKEPTRWSRARGRSADENEAVEALLKEHHVRLTNYDRVFTFHYLLHVHRFPSPDAHCRGYVFHRFVQDTPVPSADKRAAVVALLEGTGVCASKAAAECKFTLQTSVHGVPSAHGLDRFFTAILSCPTGRMLSSEYVSPHQLNGFLEGASPVSEQLLKEAERMLRRVPKHFRDEGSLPDVKEDNRRSWAARHHKR